MKRIILAVLALASLVALPQASKPRVQVGTLANLVARVPNTNEVVEVLGYLSAGDWGGPRVARFDGTSSATTNRGCVFAPTGSSGRFIFDDCESGRIDIRWFGAEPDDEEDDYTSIQAARDEASLVGASLFVPVGEFEISQTIRDVTGVSMKGVEVEYPSGGSCITWTGATNGWILVVGTNSFITGPTIRDLTFNGNFKGNGLLITNATRTLVDRSFFGKIYGYGIRSISANCQIQNSYFVTGTTTNSVGIAVGVGSAIRVFQNTFTSIGIGYLALGPVHQTIRDNSFEFCNIGTWFPDTQNQGGGLIDGNYYEYNTNGHLLMGVGTAELQVGAINPRARGGGYGIRGNTFWLTEAYPGNTNTLAVHLDNVNNVSLENNVFGSRLWVTAGATNIHFGNNHFPMWLSLPMTNLSTMYSDFDQYGVDDSDQRPYVTNVLTTPNLRLGTRGQFQLHIDDSASTSWGRSNRLNMASTALWFDNSLEITSIGAGKIGSNARWGFGSYPQSTNVMGRLSASYPYASSAIWGNIFAWADDAVPNAGKGGSIGLGGYYSDGSDPLPAAFVILEGVRQSTDYSTKGIFDIKARDSANAFQTVARFRSDVSDLNTPILMPEQTSEPATPPANSLVFYASDNGAGKTVLVVKWSSGETNVIATMP